MYVIKKCHTYKTKDGIEHEMISYFERLGVFGFVVLTRFEDAKKYDFLTEARRDKRKYFNSDKRCSIEKI